MLGARELCVIRRVADWHPASPLRALSPPTCREQGVEDPAARTAVSVHLHAAQRNYQCLLAYQ